MLTVARSRLPSCRSAPAGGAADDTGLASKAFIHASPTHQVITLAGRAPPDCRAYRGAGGILVASADATNGQQAVLGGRARVGAA